jgi:predicted phosphodiesterase
MVTVALLSDIHGNLPALEKVAEDLRSHSPDAVFVLGDMINGCPWSDRVLDRLLEYGWPMLLGNHDDAVLQLDTPRMEPRYADRQRYATLWWTRDQLSPSHSALLESLPTEMQLRYDSVTPLRLVHGIPGNFFIGLRPDSPEGWAARQLESIIESTLAGGHTHVPMIRRIRRWLVINTGSVAACYDGDARASYALLHGDGHDWHAEIRRVAYDLSAVDAGYQKAAFDRRRRWPRCSDARMSGLPGVRLHLVDTRATGRASSTCAAHYEPMTRCTALAAGPPYA